MCCSSLGLDSNVFVSQKHLQGERRLSTVVLDFEGVGDYVPVGNFYNGGTGPNYGIAFSDNAYAFVDSDAGGSAAGPVANEPSPSTIMYSLGTDSIIDVSAGFINGISFYYTSPFESGAYEVYDSLGGTGIVLASGAFATTPTGPGDPNGGDFGVWILVDVTFNGVAKSVRLSSSESGTLYDNISFDLVAAVPTKAPTRRRPTKAPTRRRPTKAPTRRRPTKAPTRRRPTKAPKRRPTKAPTRRPTKRPTPSPI
jgi:hypothetical protein